MNLLLPTDWKQPLSDVIDSSDFHSLLNKVEEERKQYTIFPSEEDLFTAFRLTPFDQTKVVILGQDPYHGQGQAHGLSFSVQSGVKVPPSLKNIYKELQADLGCTPPKHGYLKAWAEQGVLLLNTILTVRESKPLSHKGLGWERFTDRVIQLLNEREQPMIFVLWGKPAQMKKKLISNSHHLIIESVHPSPLSASRGFFGSKPFSQINQFLQSHQMEPINWQLPE